jgi:hypothetical protein
MPPELWADVAIASLNAALTAIDAGMPNGQRYSGVPAAKGTGRMAGGAAALSWQDRSAGSPDGQDLDSERGALPRHL